MHWAIQIQVIVLLAATGALQASERRVLFIGNSLTYSGGGVDVSVADFAAADGSNWTTVRRAPPGWTLSDHRGSQDTLDRINDPAGWDTVVLHDYSNRPLTNPSGFHADVAALVDIIRAAGAEPVLFMTWAYRSDLGMTSGLDHEYTTAGSNTGSKVAPVGLAWYRARLDGATDVLFADDKHQTNAGTYLSSAVIYGLIANIDPRHNSHDGGLSSVLAAQLRAIASATLEPSIDGSGDTGSGSPTSIAAGSVLEAEDYDRGGEGVGYHDTTPTNYGGKHRSDDVDIESTQDTGGGHNIGWTEGGEWLRYSLRVTGDQSLIPVLRIARSYDSTGNITVAIAGASSTVAIPPSGGWQNWIDVPAPGLRLDPGDHTLHLTFGSGGINLNHLRFVSPDSAADIPTHGNGGAAWTLIDGASIEAEDYDTGGPGVAYHDADSSNKGGKYRFDGVDIETTADLEGGYNVGWIDSGEWLTYTVTSAVGQDLDLGLRVARSYGSTGSVRIEVGGEIRSLAIPSTGGWQQWQTVWLSQFPVPAGRHVLRIRFDSNGINFNRIDFRTNSVPAAPTHGNAGQAWALGELLQIEAEDFDTDGPGRAYDDRDVSNNGGKYRSDGVDIEDCTDTGGGFNVGWIEADEWLGFTVESDQDGVYELRLRVARAYTSGGAITAEIGGSSLETAIPSTGGWKTWTTQTLGNLHVPAGRHRLTLRFPSAGTNLNHLVLERVPSTAG